MKIDVIKLMVDYNNWANTRILEAAEKLTPEQFTAQQSVSLGSLRGTLLHTMDTEWGWRVLLQHNDNVPVMQESDFPDIATLRTRWDEEQASWEEYLNSLNDDAINGIITYGSPEIKRERVLWHCLYHVVNHGMQHRSEAATLLTNFGQSPGGLDFTAFMNEQKRPATDTAPVTLDDIKLIHRYNDWANSRILDTADKLTPEQLHSIQAVSWGSLAGTLVHTMDSEDGWRKLLQKSVVEFRQLTAQDFAELAAIRARWDEITEARWQYLDSLSDDNMNDIITYKIPEGERSRVLWQSLYHVVNHGSQHRSEAAVILTNFDHSPGEIDFTMFLNEQKNA